MNYSKVSAIVVHDEHYVLNITVKTKNHNSIEIFNCSNHNPWPIYSTLSNELRRIQRYLNGSMYRLNVVTETESTIMYDIDVVDTCKPWEVNQYILEKGK